MIEDNNKNQNNKKNTGKKLNFILFIFLVIFSFSIASIIYWIWADYNERVTILESEKTNFEEKLSSVVKNIQNTNKTLQKKAESSLLTIDSIYEDLENQKDILQILKEDYSSIEEKISTSENLNIKSEIEYLLRIASYSLDIMLDPISARKILSIAKERIKKLTDKKYDSVKKSLNEKFTLLSHYANNKKETYDLLFDTQSIIKKELTKTNQITENQESISDNKFLSGKAEEIWNSILSTLGNHIKVTKYNIRSDKVFKERQSYKSFFYIQENLTQAMFSLESRNATSFKNSIQYALIETRNIETTDLKKTLTKNLKKLEKIKIQPIKIDMKDLIKEFILIKNNNKQ